MPSSSLNDRYPVADGTLDGVLRGPESVLAAIPYLLGFHPQNSLVIVWMQDRRICLTQRMDLIPVNGDLELMSDSIAGVASTCDADCAVGVVYGSADGTDRGWRLDVYEAMDCAIEKAGVRLIDVLHVYADRWWSYECDEPCCPQEGRTISPSVREQVAALLGESGVEPATSREAVVESMERDPLASAQVAVRIAEGQARLEERLVQSQSWEAELEVWRDEQIARWLPVFTGTHPGEPGPDVVEIHDLLLCLADIRVRDTVLWHLASVGATQGCMDWLVSAMRAAPAGHVAPVAACAAICAWLRGDGVRANAALDRALADNDRYSLAWLVGQSIAYGLPPSSWREVMGRLSESECRNGASPPVECSDDQSDPGSPD